MAKLNHNFMGKALREVTLALNMGQVSHVHHTAVFFFLFVFF